MLDRAGALARAARGYLAGFGTSGSLLAVAVLLFIVASALVAFRGWPHVGAQPSPGEVVISQRPTAATASPSSRRLAVFSVLPSTRAGGGAATGVTGAPGAGLRRVGATTPSHSLGRPVSVSVPVPGAGGSAPSCTTGGCGSTPAPVTPGGGGGPTQPVQQAIGQTSGELGGALSGTGKTVGSVVQRATGAVAGAVQPVSPPAAGVVGSAGAGAAKTVTGVTQTIAGALSGLTKH